MDHSQKNLFKNIFSSDKKLHDANLEIYLESIIERTPAYIFWKDINFIYQGCNHRFARLVGRDTPKEVI